MAALRYEEIIEIGPRRVSKTQGWPLIYLPKELSHLYGRKVIVVLKILPAQKVIK